MAEEEMDRLQRRLARGDARARVGVIDDEVAAERLNWAEFGTERHGETYQPARPTITAAWDAHESAIARALQRGAAALVHGDVTTGVAALRAPADALVELVVDRIDGDTPPVLAPSTLAARRRRGNYSGRTLVDSRHMLNAIRAEVRPVPFGTTIAEPAPAQHPAKRMAPGRDKRGRFT